MIFYDVVFLCHDDDNGNNDNDEETSSDPQCKYGNGTLKHCLI